VLHNDKVEGYLMLALVRIHVPSSIHDSKHHERIRVNPDHIWDYVMKHHESWDNDGPKIFYMTQRYMQDDTSLIMEAKDLDSIADFLLKHFAANKYVRGIWVLNLAKMTFFEIPPDHLEGLDRFTVTIDATPQHLEKIFDSISSFGSSNELMINYITYTFQSFNSSIMLSMLARNKNHMESFVNEYIKPLEGVLSTDITYIHRTIRLVSSDEWKKSFGHMYRLHGGEQIKDIDADEDTSRFSCC